MITAGDLSSLLQLGGTVGAIAFFLFALLKGWVVPQAMYRQMREDRDQWKEVAMTSIRAAERGIGVAEEGLQYRPPRRTRAAP